MLKGLQSWEKCRSLNSQIWDQKSKTQRNKSWPQVEISSSGLLIMSLEQKLAASRDLQQRTLDHVFGERNTMEWYVTCNVCSPAWWCPCGGTCWTNLAIKGNRFVEVIRSTNDKQGVGTTPGQTLVAKSQHTTITRDSRGLSKQMRPFCVSS